MATTLSQFFAELATDAQKLAAFLKSPESVLQSSDLSEEDQATLKTKDAAKLNETLRAKGVSPDLVQVASLGNKKAPITWVADAKDATEAPITWVADAKSAAPITWVVGDDSDPGAMA